MRTLFLLNYWPNLQFEDEENLWKVCIENLGKIEHRMQTQIFRMNQNPRVEVYLENGSLEANRIDSEEFSETQ